jgi:hypothetical protein
MWSGEVAHSARRGEVFGLVKPYNLPPDPLCVRSDPDMLSGAFWREPDQSFFLKLGQGGQWSGRLAHFSLASSRRKVASQALIGLRLMRMATGVRPALDEAKLTPPP